MIFKYLLPFSRLPFCFVDGFLHCAEAPQFDVIPFVYFSFCCPCLRRLVQEKILLRPVSRTLLPVFSSGSFMVSGLQFNSLIHLEFIFVRGVRQ